jgi:membrane protein YqaA with SNARE-associated domain
MKFSHLRTTYVNTVTTCKQKLNVALRQQYSLWILGLISFAESALPVPIITDPFMVAYIMAHRSRATLAVIVTTLSSVAGGLAAYLAAAFFSDTVLKLLSDSMVEEFNSLVTNYSDSASLLGFLGALTPIPFTTASVVAGVLHGNIFLFIIGAAVGRLIRYGITGYLTYRFGVSALALAKQNIWPIAIGAFVCAGLYLWLGM